MIYSIEPFNEPGLSAEENEMVQSRIANILDGWEDTPYMPGMSCQGRGVDCVHFVSAVLDVLRGSHASIPVLPQDIAFHDKAGSQAGMRQFLRAYPAEEVQGNILQPGDVLVCGPMGGGPGHGIIAGTDSLWQCDTSRVSRCGLSVSGRGMYFVKKAFRLYGRETWAWR